MADQPQQQGDSDQFRQRFPVGMRVSFILPGSMAERVSGMVIGYRRSPVRGAEVMALQVRSDGGRVEFPTDADGIQSYSGPPLLPGRKQGQPGRSNPTPGPMASVVQAGREATASAAPSAPPLVSPAVREAATSGPPSPLGAVGKAIFPANESVAGSGVPGYGLKEMPLPSQPPRPHVVPPPTPMAQEIVEAMARPTRTRPKGVVSDTADILERAGRRTHGGAPYRLRDDAVPPSTPTQPPIPLAGAGGTGGGGGGGTGGSGGGFYPPINPYSMAQPANAGAMGRGGPPQDVTAILRVVQKISTDSGAILAVIQKISVSGPGGNRGAGGAVSQRVLTAKPSDATAKKLASQRAWTGTLKHAAGTAMAKSGISDTTQSVARGAMTGGLAGAGMALVQKVAEKGVPGVMGDVGHDVGKAATQAPMKAMAAPFMPLAAGGSFAMGAAKGAMEAPLEMVKSALSTFGDAVTAPVKMLEQLGQAAAGGVKVLGEIAGTGIVSVFQSMAGTMMPFVQALSPSAVLVFNQAMRDLQAVVGTALLPVFQGLTSAVRQTADVMLPIARQLQPVFASLASTGLGILQPALQAFAATMEFVTPVLSFFAEMAKGLVAPLQAAGALFSAVLKTIGQALASLFGDSAKNFASGFQSAMKSLANAAVIAAGGLAQLVGATRFLSNLHAAVSKGPDRVSTQNYAAATNATTTSFPAYAKSVLTAAFTATPTGGPAAQTEKDLLKESRDVLTLMKDGQLDVKREIVKAIEAAADTIVDGIIAGIFGDKEAFDAATEETQRRAGGAQRGSALGLPGAALGAAFPGLFGG